ncbi:hypothetical protein [Flavobacterium sp. LB2R40]|uniref:hypothetical protein n=1 Tax=Flavobacterium sp. LB2R40 TaxID=3401722 RepID=UPI003AB0C846
MPYKYSNDSVNLQDSNGDSCFIDYIEKDTEAYRWSFQDINDPKNFIPMAKDPNNSSSRRKCGGWALSFHVTEEASIELWQKLNDMKPNYYKKIGTHIAKGQISKSDGKCSETDKYSHFNLIEYKNVDLKVQFTIVKQLVSDEIMQTL